MTPTVEEALHNLKAALRVEQSEAIVRHLEAVLGAKPAPNGHAPKPKRAYRMSKAGRARQIAAMKRYWRAKRKAGKGRGK